MDSLAVALQAQITRQQDQIELLDSKIDFINSAQTHIFGYVEWATGLLLGVVTLIFLFNWWKYRSQDIAIQKLSTNLAAKSNSLMESYRREIKLAAEVASVELMNAKAKIDDRLDTVQNYVDKNTLQVKLVEYSNMRLQAESGGYFSNVLYIVNEEVRAVLNSPAGNDIQAFDALMGYYAVINADKPVLKKYYLEAVSLLNQLEEKYPSNSKTVESILIDLEKIPVRELKKKSANK